MRCHQLLPPSLMMRGVDGHDDALIDSGLLRNQRVVTSVASTPATGDGVRTVPVERWCSIAVATVMATCASGSSCLGAGSDLSLSVLHSVRGVRESNHGVHAHHVGEAGTPRMTKKTLPGASNVEVVL
jgi:hypothetical protein